MTSPIVSDTRREACRRGGLARAAQFTAKSQADAQAKRSRASLQAAGKKGYKATVASKGPEFGREILRNYRKARPSDITRIVMTWLEGTAYELEVPIDRFDADIVVESKLVVRVNGNIWHRNDPLHGRNVEARDAAELELYLELGYTVITLWEDEIKDGSARSTLQEQLCYCRNVIQESSTF